jgi:hypothetical protein
MSKKIVLHRETPTMSAGTTHADPGRDQAGSSEQTSKGAWTHDHIARRAYELYEQRGRQEGRALEDWLNAERQLAGTSGQSQQGL